VPEQGELATPSDARAAHRTLLSIGTMVGWEENQHIEEMQRVEDKARKPFNAVGLDRSRA
jgi:hypothetical protein